MIRRTEVVFRGSRRLRRACVLRRRGSAALPGLLRSGGRGCYAHFFELGAGAAFFFGAGVFFNDFAEFADAGGLLPQLELGHGFFEAGGGEFEALGVVGENFVVFGDSLFVIFLRVGDFSEVELRVGSEVGVAVVVEIVLEFLASEIVFAAGDVAEAVGIESVGRRGRACWRRRRGWLGWRHQRRKVTGGSRIELLEVGVVGGGAVPEIFASRLCTVFCRSTNC